MAFRRAQALRLLDLANKARSSRPLHTARSAAVPEYSHRILQRQPPARPALPQLRLPLPAGDKLADEIRLDVNSHSPPPELKKILGVSRMDAVRTRLSAIPRSSISRSDFLRICREESNADDAAAAAISRSLEESAAVIAVGNLVFLRPGEVRNVHR